MSCGPNRLLSSRCTELNSELDTWVRYADSRVHRAPTVRPTGAGSGYTLAAGNGPAGITAAIVEPARFEPSSLSGSSNCGELIAIVLSEDRAATPVQGNTDAQLRRLSFPAGNEILRERHVGEVAGPVDPIGYLLRALTREIEV